MSGMMLFLIGVLTGIILALLIGAFGLNKTKL
jgi:uncharacterized membrane protein